MTAARIRRIEWGRLEGRRPRAAGSNARLGTHGPTVRPALARLTLDDGSSGFGACGASKDAAQAILGVPLDALFAPETGTTSAGRSFDYPLWDLAAKRAGQPVYVLAGRATGRQVAAPLRAPCYDTSLYIDDLHLTSDAEAAALIAAEAREGYERGHRAFKIKVGRGARHLPLEEGTRRDIAVVAAVREAVGPGLPLLLDANNGYNLNLAKRVLDETAQLGVYWLEEAFHEDAVLYRDLKEWLAQRGLPVLIADGEGQASPSLLQWAQDGLVDVVQYDIIGHTFTGWLATGPRLDAAGVRSAPHHYGGHFGNYAAGHLTGAIQRFTYVEWDEATTPGLDGSAYRLEEGWVHLPEAPGFGLDLEEAAFQQAVQAGGYAITA